ncbi:unnamed protein product [Fraxinus pennsylvanica]|uniref:Uncharacterized protein n=1 Tax=Fraxinus pennsylvanica TaxID=56036 RepID=A0AAD1ZNQ2_9LAMI|nr:unnamed protein product [Fraxinus pennsylvanica]
MSNEEAEMAVQSSEMVAIAKELPELQESPELSEVMDIMYWKRLFQMINDVPNVFEVVTGTVKQVKDQATAPNNNGKNKSSGRMNSYRKKKLVCDEEAAPPAGFSRAAASKGELLLCFNYLIPAGDCWSSNYKKCHR